jgi:hypothetical protein
MERIMLLSSKTAQLKAENLAQELQLDSAPKQDFLSHMKLIVLILIFNTVAVIEAIGISFFLWFKLNISLLHYIQDPMV